MESNGEEKEHDCIEQKAWQQNFKDEPTSGLATPHHKGFKSMMDLTASMEENKGCIDFAMKARSSIQSISRLFPNQTSRVNKPDTRVKRSFFILPSNNATIEFDDERNRSCISSSIIATGVPGRVFFLLS